MNQSGIVVQGYWEPSQVVLDVQGSFVPSDNVRQHIQANWEEKVKKHPKIFNGSMVRIKSFSASSQLILETELTDFAAYLATREPSFSQEFNDQERANPLGMNIIPLTSDKKVIITRRSLTSEHNPGTLNFIGGYIDPDLKDKKSPLSIETQVKRELEEELNILPTQVKKIVIQGIGYDPYVCHYEMFTVAILNKSATEIEADWSRGIDSTEANKVMFISLQELKERAVDNTLPFPPCWSFSIGTKLLFANDLKLS